MLLLIHLHMSMYLSVSIYPCIYRLQILLNVYASINHGFRFMFFNILVRWGLQAQSGAYTGGGFNPA